MDVKDFVNFNLLFIYYIYSVFYLTLYIQLVISIFKLLIRFTLFLYQVFKICCAFALGARFN